MQCAYSSVQEGLQKRGIEVAQLLAQPELARQRVFDIKAVRGAGIKDQTKAQFDDEQGVAEQKAAQLRGVKQAFADTDEKGFEVGAFGMSGPSQPRAMGLPLL